jgi:dTDP-4-dehydrorhamnose 3,5-epimerase
MSWTIDKTDIEGCLLIKNPVFPDKRGSFSETYKKSLFIELGLPEMQQDNHLQTIKGGIRAMHWQDGQFAQAKLINVIEGEIFDAVYDLRKDSPTFMKLATFNLDENSPLLFVPAGCAHGFQGISESSIVHYKTDNEYNLASQRSFLWNDSLANINWPIREAIVSEKDSLAPELRKVLFND